MQPLFLVPTKAELDLVAKLDAQLECEEKKHRAAAPKSEALQVEIDRLVKRGESPTRDFHNFQRNSEINGIVNAYEAHKRKVFNENLHTCPEPLSLSSRKTTTLSEFLANTPIENSIGVKQPSFLHREVSKAGESQKIPAIDYRTGELKQELEPKPDNVVRMYRRDWSGQYRIGLETKGLGARVQPPETSGERITSDLTKNATRAIMESGAYLSACRNGYTTFLTLTFDEKSRQDLETKIAISGNKTKRYTHKYRAYNHATKRFKNFTEKYDITCYEGVPAALDPENDEEIMSHANAVPASGAFSPVSFDWKTTIGKEVSRFFDTAQKMYQRGWWPQFEAGESRDYQWPVKNKDNGQLEQETVSIVCYEDSEAFVEPKVMFCPQLVRATENSGEIITQSGLDMNGQPMYQLEDKQKYNARKHHEPEYLPDEFREYPWGKVCSVYPTIEKGAPLDYMWVAEQPTNSKGEKNPHVHVLMRWSVEKKYFRAWARRLEDAWGHGFAKLERIKNPHAAGNYILKAVGYLTKGGDSKAEQGEILGNRYGLSASARAPKWECIGEFFADNFLAILGELREKLSRRKLRLHSEKQRLLAEQAKQSANFKKFDNIEKKAAKNGMPSTKRQALIERLKGQLLINDAALTECTEALHEMPWVNEFCLGAMSENQASEFLHWAMAERFWNADVKEGLYSDWQELRETTAAALKEVRSYWRHYEHTLVGKHMQNSWAANDLRYEMDGETQYSILDEFGNEWELVA
ncbi:rolling circle replication-associated protein [Thalassotalea euphylliae]|uniref:Replication-associated protein ORF2/G2P domain-containing protein n=1 Tax=Thalassotalea euphylliae TaxID=1655234 RepID=A0A3E0U2T9_9GAMM|nr:hypothetical protein [Thalassotalea euphylliae]REL31069.1 hypothetical protein DXX94_10280 [Thalassotalea euphylliae]